MTVHEDIQSKILYAQGPEGQRVVVVPLGVPIEEKETSLLCYYGFSVCLFLGAIITFLAGIYHLAISLDYYINNGFRRDQDTTCYIILAIAVLLAIFGILCWRRAGSVKAKQVLQYMHKDDPGERRSSEDRHLEEFVMRHERRGAPPGQPLIPTSPSPGITDDRPSS